MKDYVRSCTVDLDGVMSVGLDYISTCETGWSLQHILVIFLSLAQDQSSIDNRTRSTDLTFPALPSGGVSFKQDISLASFS